MAAVVVSSAAADPNGLEPTKQNVRCCFCPRKYRLAKVKYGGRTISVCPPCGERCIESGDDNEEDKADVVGGDDVADQKSIVVNKSDRKRVRSRSYCTQDTGCQPTASNQPKGPQKQDDINFYWDMGQALERTKARLIHDKKFWEFVKEGEEAMQTPENDKIVASTFEKQKDFNRQVIYTYLW